MMADQIIKACPYCLGDTYPNLYGSTVVEHQGEHYHAHPKCRARHLAFEAHATELLCREEQRAHDRSLRVARSARRWKRLLRGIGYLIGVQTVVVRHRD